MEVKAPPEQPTERSTRPAPTTATSTPPPQRQIRRRRVSGWAGLRVGEMVLLSVLIVDAFLALDFIFRATAVSRDGFVSVVGRVGDSLASPFTGLFGGGMYQLGHTTFWAALLALVIYTLAALIVVRLFHLFTHPLRRAAVDG